LTDKRWAFWAGNVPEKAGGSMRKYFRIDSGHIPIVRKPYAMVGAARLSSAIYKSGSEEAGWRYRFNVFRMRADGTVDQNLAPADLVSLLKLVKVLAATLEDDGCLSVSRRRELRDIAIGLDRLLRDMSGAGDGGNSA
jgi:hypothetical protein